MTKSQRSNLLPKRYEDDLFVCDIMDAVPKGDMASMEHPLFSLSTKSDMKSRRYENGNKWLEVKPGDKGLATVHDRDILIYCISQCKAAFNEGRSVTRHLEIDAYRLLEATNRASSGAGNDLLKAALDRLAGTRIETNITQGNTKRTDNFGLIDAYTIISETRHNRIQKLRITLSEWMFEAIEHNNILTLNKQYFRLRKPLERRLYELARKHCGQQPKWEIGITKLQEKIGSLSNTKEFKRMLTKVITDNLTHNHMPDYTFELVDQKLVVRPIRKTLTGTSLPPLKSDTYEEARHHAKGWDIRALEGEWRDWVAAKNIAVRNADSNFISFCKKRGPYKNEELF